MYCGSSSILYSGVNGPKYNDALCNNNNNSSGGDIIPYIIVDLYILFLGDIYDNLKLVSLVLLVIYNDASSNIHLVNILDGSNTSNTLYFVLPKIFERDKNFNANSNDDRHDNNIVDACATKNLNY